MLMNEKLEGIDERSMKLHRKHSYLKRRTGSVIMATPKQSFHTKDVARNMYHTSDEPMFRLCRKKPENVTQTISDCQILSQREYKNMTEFALTCIASFVRKYGYDHVSLRTLEGKPTIVWDYDFQTAKQIEKIRNYSELSRLWKMPEENVKVIPVVIRALDSILLEFKENFEHNSEKYTFRTLQKSALLITANMLRNVLPFRHLTFYIFPRKVP